MISKEKRAEAFHSIVSPYFHELNLPTIVEFCAGDGKAGAEFDKDEGIEKIIFVDIKQPNKLKKNIGMLHSYSISYLCGLENFYVPSDSFIIALHSCGILTDKILEKAVLSKSPVAVMPCCYNQNMKKYHLQNPPDKRRLVYDSEKDYYDAFRLQYLRENNYIAVLKNIDKKITPMNNILIGIPKSA